MAALRGWPSGGEGNHEFCPRSPAQMQIHWGRGRWADDTTKSCRWKECLSSRNLGENKHSFTVRKRAPRKRAGAQVRAGSALPGYESCPVLLLRHTWDTCADIAGPGELSGPSQCTGPCSLSWIQQWCGVCVCVCLRVWPRDRNHSQVKLQIIPKIVCLLLRQGLPPQSPCHLTCLVPMPC